MPFRKICALITMAIIMLLAACGGGGPSGGGGAEGDAPAGGGEAATVVDAATAGSISGKVMFSGTAPNPELIHMDAEPSCAEEFPDGRPADRVVVNANGTLANVFVYVKSGLEGMTFPTSSEKVLLDQHGCTYVPHVLGVQTNQTVVVRNSDSFLHNIHPMPENSRGFNIGQPTEGMETERSFPAAEVMIPVTCDVHGWMQSYIGVVDHPYFAVTGSDGSFNLPNLPPGDYVLEAWQEIYGPQTVNVTVGESESVSTDFTFQGG